MKKCYNCDQQDGDFGDDDGDCAANAPAEPNDIDIEAAEEEGRRGRGPPPFLREARQAACENVSNHGFTYILYLIYSRHL